MSTELPSKRWVELHELAVFLINCIYRFAWCPAFFGRVLESEDFREATECLLEKKEDFRPFLFQLASVTNKPFRLARTTATSAHDWVFRFAEFLYAHCSSRTRNRRGVRFPEPALLHRTGVHLEWELSQVMDELPMKSEIETRVVLQGPDERPIVRGLQKRKLTKPQYNVVKALMDAGEAGLTKDELVNKSRHEDARGILKRLADSDPDWKEVIHFAGRTGGRYRVK